MTRSATALRLARQPAPDPSRVAAAWERARSAWLDGKVRNVHTRRAYAKALDEFAAYLEDEFSLRLWQAESRHARRWREYMTEQHLAPTTITQRMASVSGFYQFVATEARLILEVEPALLDDARGEPHANPFRADSVERPHLHKYAHSSALRPEVVQSMMQRINRETPTGARDYALLLTFLYTGWRSKEVLHMRWGDMAPNPSRAGEFQCLWSGKGREQEVAPLPAKVAVAITQYLALAGRDPKPDEYIWQPLSTRGCANFDNVGPLSENRPISGTQANNILRKRLRMAGICDPASYHIHSLRHTFAHTFASQKGDIPMLSRRLHHASSVTTQVYVEALASPADDYSADLASVYGV